MIDKNDQFEHTYFMNGPLWVAKNTNKSGFNRSSEFITLPLVSALLCHQIRYPNKVFSKQQTIPCLSGVMAINSWKKYFGHSVLQPQCCRFGISILIPLYIFTGLPSQIIFLTIRTVVQHKHTQTHLNPKPHNMI